MKKAFTLALFFCLVASVKAQITFNIADLPVAGQTQRIAIDTLPLPTVNFGSKGANQFYDFSNLTLYKYDTVEFRTPTSNQLSTCPNADVALTTDGTNFLLTNTDNVNNKLILEGFQGQLTPGNNITAAYSTKPDLYQFPTNYQTHFEGTAYLQKTVPGSAIGQPLVTSVELTINTIYTDTIDGWGRVKTPLGTYKCLRKQRKETTHTVIRTLVFGSWSTYSDETKTTLRYQYVTKEAKGTVVNFSYDTANVLQSVNWSMVPPTAPVANFGYTAGAAGSVSFTDSSDFYPTTWAWTFGDGGTSTQQNPGHTYAANGTYTVCLTATNAGGSSTQVCKQVVINNIVLAPVADFNWSNVSGGLVNFSDVSTNGPTTWAWTFGDATTSTQQNPSHVYATNNTYNVCLTASNTAGSNQRCKNVVVTLVSAGNSAPVALNDTASVLQPSGVTRNVGLNDVDPNGDNFCITLVYGSAHFADAGIGNCTSITYTPDSSFIGSDSCYYVICDNGTPVLCDTGKFVVTSIELNIAPIATNDTLTVNQGEVIVFHAGQNDSDANGDSLCVQSVWGTNSATKFIGGSCDEIYYISDTCFNGQQIFFYSICDNGNPSLCDTAIIVMNVIPDSSLIAHASFSNLDYDIINGQTLTVPNTSQNYTSSIWVVHQFDANQTDTIISDTLYYVDFTPSQFWGSICLTVSNECNSNTHCDTLQIFSINVNDISLIKIAMYPNPANSNIIIDMSQNGDEATLNYAAIEVYNALGEKVRVVNDKTSRVVSISVGDLTQGMYMATLLDAKGARRNLGRFVVSH
jgi:PKD repeat protein